MPSGPRRPLWVWVDAAATCNLACKLCYTATMQSKEVMQLVVFEALVRRLQETSASIVKFHLNWRGEPTSNPRLPSMLARLADTRWDVEWHTNATLLHPALAARIVAANARQTIYLSLDGGNAASFDGNRGPGLWEKALRGAETVLAARGDLPGPRIGIYQLDLGVPRDLYDPRFLALTDRVDSYVVVPPIDLNGSGTGSAAPRSEIPPGPCFWLGNTLAVDTQGQAWTCLLRNGTRLGSLLDESVDDLLDRAASLRQLVERSTRAAVAGCSSCRKREGAPFPIGAADQSDLSQSAAGLASSGA